jgi:hypothetical protein
MEQEDSCLSDIERGRQMCLGLIPWDEMFMLSLVRATNLGPPLKVSRLNDYARDANGALVKKAAAA